MKKTFLTLLLIFPTFLIFAQQSNYPVVNLKTLEGKTISSQEIFTQGKPILIDFWATWCKPCIIELNTLTDYYEDWQDETGVIIYAISVDDAKTYNRVAPFVNSHDWEYNVLLDQNSDFKRAMNVVNIPHMFLISPEGKIVWEHTGFAPGTENEIYEQLKKLSSSLFSN